MWVSKMFPVEAIGLGATPLKEPFNLIIRCVPGIVQSALFALTILFGSHGDWKVLFS